MNTKQIIKLILSLVVAAYGSFVLYNLLIEKLPLQDALIAKKRIKLKPTEPDEDIPDGSVCITESDDKAFDFTGTPVTNPRNTPCKTCGEYVYKMGNTCSPYKYSRDGYCVVDHDVTGECPF